MTLCWRIESKTVVERCRREEEVRRDDCVDQEIEVAIFMGDGVEDEVEGERSRGKKLRMKFT